MTQNETRFSIFQAVLNEYGEPDQGCELPESADDQDFGEIPQFVMVQRDSYRDTWYVFGATAEELCEGAACDDSDYEPYLVVDLTSGAARNVEVSYQLADTITDTYAAAAAGA
jgi:hypothetical protein